MVTHCYFYRLKEGVDPDEAVRKLCSMGEQIPEIESIEVGRNFSQAANAFDIVQLSRFKTEQDFAAFSRHPYHQKLRDYFSQAAAETAKVDYVSP